MNPSHPETARHNGPGLKPVTVPRLSQWKSEGRRIAMVTAYDASFAAQVDAAEIDVVLVGDSLGMVIQGHDSTLPVTIGDMVYHTAAVSRGLRRALLVADMPFMADRDVEHALDSAHRLVGEGGAAMVKLEGAGPMCAIIEALASRGVPVCGHLGLTPQSVHKLGGYRVQGRSQAAAEQLLADARAVADSGADLLVLECVPAELATRIAGMLAIPVIGIGAGAGCDGQVLVLYDLLGITPGKVPSFSRDFLAGHGSIPAALAAYVAAVREGSFPNAAEQY